MTPEQAETLRVALLVIDILDDLKIRCHTVSEPRSPRNGARRRVQPIAISPSYSLKPPQLLLRELKAARLPSPSGILPLRVEATPYPLQATCRI